MNIKDFAKEYEPQRMGNITDLETVRADLEIHREERMDQSGEKYNVMFVVVDGKEYRIPASVVEQVKAIVEAKPDLVAFKVSKSGEGKGTKYQVISL